MSSDNSLERSNLRVHARVEGSLLRLETPGVDAMDAAVDLLGFLQTELEADVPVDGWQPNYKRKLSEPIPIQLEGLHVELSTDGSEIELRRVGGSKTEFEELCELVVAECVRG